MERGGVCGVWWGGEGRGGSCVQQLLLLKWTPKNEECIRERFPVKSK